MRPLEQASSRRLQCPAPANSDTRAEERSCSCLTLSSKGPAAPSSARTRRMTPHMTPHAHICMAAPPHWNRLQRGGSSVASVCHAPRAHAACELRQDCACGRARRPPPPDKQEGTRKLMLAALAGWCCHGERPAGAYAPLRMRVGVGFGPLLSSTSCSRLHLCLCTCAERMLKWR